MSDPALPDHLHLETIVSVPFDENSYLAWLDGRDDCLLIDPGLQPQQIVDAVERLGLTPAAILNTHGHSDHIAGNERMKQQWPQAPLVIGVGDVPKLSDPAQNLSAMFGFRITSPPADATLSEGDVYSAAGFDLEVREIPGHSSGHVVFIWRANPHVVFGGDILFAGSIGNPNFPDGDEQLLIRGIREKLFDLPDVAVVLPGHGPATTIGREKASNPFLQ